MRFRFLLAAPCAAVVVLTGTLLVACSTQTPPAQSPGPDPKQEPAPITRPAEGEVRNTLPPVPIRTDTATPETAHEAEMQGGVHRQAKTRALMQPRLYDQTVSSVMPRPSAPPYQDYGRENYQSFLDNGVQWAADNPVSTFSIDVDSAAYANVRRLLNQGQLPDPDAVRVEEMINYFAYDYPAPADKETPFGVYTEMGPSPWHADRKLLHVGIRGWQPDQTRGLPPANLVFLIDVSGSMQAPDKIDLLKSAMKMLVDQLRPEDRIAIAVYAGAAGEVLAPTAGDRKAVIKQAIDNLRAGGSTNGGAGIQLAYNLARQNLIKDGVNRVILATDGDFNVGTTNIEQLEQMVEAQRKSGVALTVLGFGTGNYNDHLMQKIAQTGNGNAAYIDTINEARKVLVDELGATLNIIAQDMKVQVEFNPAVVDTYRLIGYETRHLKREDFNNDRVDAGDVGAGHTVTALYEISLRGAGTPPADPLRYGGGEPRETEANGRGLDEVAFLKLRYKAPGAEDSRLITHPLYTRDIRSSLAATSENFRFSGAVAWLGQLLRRNTAVGIDDMQTLIRLAQDARGSDTFGYRAEFINLARTASALNIAGVSQPVAPAGDEVVSATR